MGRSEQREFTGRMTMLLIQLLKWQFQPYNQCNSWSHAIRAQRKFVSYLSSEAATLQTKFDDAAWLDVVWSCATCEVANETGLSLKTFPESCPWLISDILKEGWLPG